MKMITTILIEDEISADDLVKMKMAKEMYAQQNPEWEDDGSVERGIYIGGLQGGGLIDKDSKVMVEIRYED